MGYLPLSGRYTAFEEAKLRIVCYFLVEKKMCLICVELSNKNNRHYDILDELRLKICEMPFLSISVKHAANSKLQILYV